MNPYTHLTMNERETIFLMYEQGETIGLIVRLKMLTWFKSLTS